MKTFLFFGLHLILDRKTDLVLGWKFFILVFIILKFLPPPPLSKILRTLLRESVLIRWIIASHLCTTVGCQQFHKESRKFQTRIMFVRYYSFFHYCLLSCRYVMFHKHIPSKPKWGGAQAVVRGSTAPGPPVLTALTQPSEAMGV